MYIIAHAILHEHLLEGSCEFMVGSSLRCVTTLISPVTISTMTLEILFLIGHVTSQKHMFKGHVNLWVVTSHGESPSCLVWWLLVWCKWKYKLFNMSRDLTTTRD